MQYVNLHSHSYFSLLDGFSSPLELMRRAKELDMPAMAITDHGTLASHFDMLDAAKETGVKPILGIEAYFTADRFDRTSRKDRGPDDQVYNHLIVLAKNDRGVKNLNVLSEKAWSEGFYLKPRMDFELLEQYGDDLIIASGCMNGSIAKAIANGNDAIAQEHARWFVERFGDDFYIEVQPHNPSDLNKALLDFADSNNIKPIVTLDCHYADPKDRAAEEIMLILGTHPKVSIDSDFATSRKITDVMERLQYLYGERQMSFADLDIYMMGLEEIQSKMREFGREDIYANTQEIADKVESYAEHETKNLLPVDHANPNAQLAKRAKSGLRRRGLSGAEYDQRLEDELKVIRDKDFSSYFIIVANMIQWAKNQNIAVGPGRGSSAGSLVCYALGITDVDPLKYNLLFSRFLDPGRSDFPDIDTDFAKNRRGEIKTYLEKEYKHVGSIATWLTFKDKGVVRDVARVFNVPLSDVNRALKNVETWEQFMTSPDTIKFRDDYPEVVEYASRLRGRLRGTGMHPAGIVTSREDLALHAPMETRKDASSKDRLPVVAVDMERADKIGLIKIDALGLKALDVIQEALSEIERRHGKRINMTEVDLGDANVYKMLSDGHTSGVFQCEAPPFTSLLIKMGVHSFDELAVSNALVRPGAMNTIGAEYIARKHGKKPVHYVHTDMQDATKDTLGTIIYQEQVMQACMILGGMDMSEANRVRKIIGKKKDVSEFEEYRQKFVDGAAPKISKDSAEKLWHDFEAHAGYSFNKCTSGSTVVRRSAAGRHAQSADITVEELYNVRHSKTATGKKYRDPKRGIKIMAMDADGRVRPQRVKNVYRNGVKEVFRVTLSNGAYIDATANHKHLTADGYMRVDELNVGDTMFYSDMKYEKTEYSKSVGSGWAGGTSMRALASDGRMRPSLGGYNAEYKRNVLLLTDECANCGSNVGRLEVAHLNSDRMDSRLENLARLCNSCHKKLDYAFGSRKKRYSKGYAIEQVEIVDIRSVGHEMTYDIEMDTIEHNWLGNGIVTHNSHAVSYTMLSYWTAWLKYHYPMEFMVALLRNEHDKDSITDYLIETKRLGIRVLLPHVNLSGKSFEIQKDGIRVGLSNIKYLSDKSADKIIAARPFKSFQHLNETASAKYSGITSRAIEYMDKIGACRFDDNPWRGDERDHLYEVLGIPEFSTTLPAWITNQVTNIGDMEEGDTGIVVGMVKGVKIGAGWSRVNIVDKTGTISAFDSDDTEVEEGTMYLMLLAGNRVASHIAVTDIKNKPNHPLVRFMQAPLFSIEDDQFFVLSFGARKTKSGDRMANVVVSDMDKQITSALVFSTAYAEARVKATPGAIIRPKIGKTKDGTMVIRGFERR